MKFAEPLWLGIGLVAGGALFWAWRRYDARQRAALAAFASSHLHARLTASFSAVRRTWKRGLFLASVLCLFVALARPQAGFRWEEVSRRGIEVVFAVDTSRSMLTPDVKPDRLTRAKLAVHDFVGHLNGDGVGLVAFAGNAFLQCPITLDYDAFNESLDALDTTIIPRGGTDIASAIHETRTALQNRANTDKILILVTDGEDLEGSALEAARAASKDGLKIYAVGVGSANGDLIPMPADQGGGFVKDDAGQFVKSRLDEAGLKAIAAATGGLYAPLGAQGEGLDRIYQQGLASVTRHDLASRRQKIYTERFQWPLVASLVLLLGSTLIGTRRRVARQPERVPAESVRRPLFAKAATATLALLGFLSFQQTQASPTTAEKAYEKGDFAAAQSQYAMAAQRDPAKTALQFNVGAAAYKAGQFPQAAEAFQKALAAEPSADPKRLAAQEDAYYNLGNTLYRTGQKTEQSDTQKTLQSWEQAVKTYDAALQLRADDADAKYNRDLVQRKLEQLKKQQQEQQQQNQKDKKDQKPDQQDKNQSRQNADQPKDQGKDQKGDSQKQPGQNNEAKKEEIQDQKTGAGSKPVEQKDQQKDPQHTDKGAQPDARKKPDQKGEQPRPTNDPPKSNAQGQAGADPQKNAANQAAAETRREPGQMTKEEARELLDSLKGEQRRLPTEPISRSAGAPGQPDEPRKNW
jgi:Ca-activated chloride channel homolog